MLYDTSTLSLKMIHIIHCKTGGSTLEGTMFKETSVIKIESKLEIF